MQVFYLRLFMREESTDIPQSKACRRLRRLPKPYYHGRAYVHWSMTTQDRKTGWLTTSFHHHFREVLLHTLVRYNLACPIYCLMPDHLHILLVGISRGSDQLKGVQFFRKNLSARSPEPFRFQSQAYDSVLREENRALDAFPAVVAYIADNPVRKELVSVRSEYTFSASLFAGMPDLDWRRKDFWSVFWTAVNS